jgi:hypothetical protein
MRKNLVLTPLMIFLAAGAASYAQDMTTATVAGRVMSQNNQPLQGVRVTIESSALLGVRNAVTDASGHFRVPLLPNGEYSITYTYPNYRARKLTLRLLAGQTSRADVQLMAIEAQEVTVEISTSRAQVDKTETVIQSNFSADALENISGRGVGALNALVPGINTSVTSQSRLSIRGGTGHGAKLLVNGTTITELLGGYTISTFTLDDLVESISLVQSPLNARYGNTDGGMVTMVTSKGSNTFRGNLRFRGSRPQWGTFDPGYANRRGEISDAYPDDDDMYKNYEVTISGPIWKDRITFTYGASLTPTAYYSPLISEESYAGSRWSTPTPEPTDRVGTFFQAPNGDIIRKSELRDYSTPDGRLYISEYNKFNQFSIFVQVTPQHQVEWNYTEANEVGTNYGYQYPGENMERSREGFASRYWNVAYKGIIGSSGVLEARYGRTFQSWWYGESSVPNDPIRLYQISSLVPIDGNYNNHNPSNYVANGLLHAAYPANVSANGSGQANFLVDAVNVDNFDGGGITGLVLNYQHLLEARGSHIIDVGMQRDRFLWQTKSGGAPLLFDSPGQIATDLKQSDIYNPNGQPGNPSLYAGKYIVFNVEQARYGDIDPYAVAQGLADRPLVLNGAVDTTYSWAYPRVLERFGNPDGFFETQMTSFYLNDLWTISDNHSVMAGVRFDNFKGWDTVREFVSYSLPTLRLEYKWDIQGDQKRLVNVSLGQFHTMTPAGLFTPQAEARYNSNRTRYWNVGSATPYLVDWEKVKDLSNYGYIPGGDNLGGPNYRSDPDWKAPVSTEFSMGYRRNLNNGGYYRMTFSYRTWENDYDYYPGEIFTMNNGNKQVRRVLRNVNEYDRTYAGVELEWDLPITRKTNFGGSYTYNRLMSNWPDRSDAGNAGSAPTVNLDSYWDTFWPREVWAPVRLLDPEHYFKFYVLFDLTAGKVKSSVALRGTYTSGIPYVDSFIYRVGFPSYPEVILGPAGGNASGGAGTAGFTDNRSVPVNTMSTYQDIWSTTLRYNLTLPLVNKVVSFVTIDINNPFNHRGIGDWFRPSGPVTTIVPVDIPNGSTRNDPYNGVWRTDGNILTQYRAHMDGRTFAVQAGLRF